MRNEPIELNGTIRDVLRLVRSDLLNTGVILTTTLVSDLPNVYGDRIQLQQVVLNLIVNGIDAARRQIRVSTSLAPEHQVLLCVADSGCGIECRISSACSNRSSRPRPKEWESI